MIPWVRLRSIKQFWVLFRKSISFISQRAFNLFNQPQWVLPEPNSPAWLKCWVPNIPTLSPNLLMLIKPAMTTASCLKKSLTGKSTPHWKKQKFVIVKEIVLCPMLKRKKSGIISKKILSRIWHSRSRKKVFMLSAAERTASDWRSANILFPGAFKSLYWWGSARCLPKRTGIKLSVKIIRHVISKRSLFNWSKSIKKFPICKSIRAHWKTQRH